MVSAAGPCRSQKNISETNSTVSKVSAPGPCRSQKTYAANTPSRFFFPMEHCSQGHRFLGKATAWTQAYEMPIRAQFFESKLTRDLSSSRANKPGLKRFWAQIFLGSKTLGFRVCQVQILKGLSGLKHFGLKNLRVKGLGYEWLTILGE